MPKEDNIMMLKVYGKLENAKKLIDEAMSLCEELQPVRITPETRETHTLDDIRSRIKEMMEQARPQAKEFVKGDAAKAQGREAVRPESRAV